MRQKVITLCDETWRLAQEMENFSAWVRAMLIQEDEDTQQERKVAEIYKERYGKWPKWWRN